MKNLLIFVSFVVVWMGYTNGCDYPSESITQAVAPSSTPPLNSNMIPPQELIRSPEYSIAKAALDKAVKDKDIETLRLGLTSTIITIRHKTAEAITNTDVILFVPDLIAALRQNQSVIS